MKSALGAATLTFLLTIALPTTVRAQHRIASPFDAVMLDAAAPSDLRTPSFTRNPADDGDRRVSGNMIASGILVSSIASFGGMYLGAVTGYSMGQYGESFGGLMVGAAVGSVVGSTLGASLAVGRPGLAFLGSVGGGAIGLVTAVGIAEMGNDTAAVIGFSVIQGTVATLLAAAR